MRYRDLHEHVCTDNHAHVPSMGGHMFSCTNAEWRHEAGQAQQVNVHAFIAQGIFHTM